MFFMTGKVFFHRTKDIRAYFRVVLVTVCGLSHNLWTLSQFVILEVLSVILKIEKCV